MTEDLRKRLIGAAVLVSLAVIFVPMLLEDDTHIDSKLYRSNIPEKQLPPFQPPAVSAEKLAEKQQALQQKQQQARQQQAFDSSIKPDTQASIQPVAPATASDETGADSKPITPRVGLSSWMIQVGSFSSHDNATKVVKQLREAGYDTHLETAQVQSKKVHRVRVGPEIDKARAEAKAKAITKQFFLNAKVIRYP